MAFSWKKAIETGIRQEKIRMEIFKKNGNMKAAEECKRQVERVKKRHGIS